MEFIYNQVGNGNARDNSNVEPQAHLFVEDTMNKQASLIKIITVDYAAFMAFVFPIIGWIVYGFFVITKEVNPTGITLPAIYGAITLVAIIVLVWRVLTITSIFNDGIETAATISNVSFFRDRGRIDCVYIYEGKKIIGGNAIMKTKRTKEIQIGNQVVVMVDRNNPKRAFIRDLYIKG